MGDIVNFRGLRSSEGSHNSGHPAPVEASVPEQPDELKLNEAIIKAMTLAGDELLPAIEIAFKLATEAEDQKDQTSFYKHIMALHAITSRILLNGGRL